MPIYDFRCPACGSVTERRRAMDCTTIACACGASARRVEVNQVGVSGFAWEPYEQRRVSVERVFNAQHDLLHEAEKQGKALPDFWAIGQRRAKAIQASGERL